MRRSLIIVSVAGAAVSAAGCRSGTLDPQTGPGMVSPTGHAGSGGGTGSGAAGGGRAGGNGSGLAGVDGGGGVISIGGAGGSGMVGGSTGNTDGGRPLLGFGCVGCTMTSAGGPLWQPVEAMIFPASASRSDDYQALVDSILVPNHARYSNVGVFGPGIPHGPPYEDELYGLSLQHHLQARQDYLHATFASPGTSLIFMLVVAAVPNGPVGRSTDYASGPIIPNSWFPMHVDARFIGPPILDPVYDMTIPGYDAFSPPIDADGPSHFVLAFRTNVSFATDGAPGVGPYDLEVRIADALDASWVVHVTFTVYPDPDFDP